MNKIKRIIIIILVILVAALLVFGLLELWYYPHYKSNKQIVQIDTVDQGKDQIKVMSCNVRTISPDDLFKRSWFYRSDLIMKNIKSNQPSIIGFQEVTSEQYKYLTDTLVEYESVITYRDNSPIKEATPIFYKKDLYDLKDKGSFWLSETPDVMSKDWGAACYRICSYVVLIEKQSGKEFVVFNTHLDHISDEARINGVKVIQEKIADFGNLPSIIMGDFNAEENTPTYESITKDFLDVKYQTDKTIKSCTYQGWGKELNSDCIDYIMISKEGFTVNSYDVVDTIYDGVYPSDHFQLIASLKLN